MSTFTFTEIQIIDIWLSSSTKCSKLSSNETFINLKQHLYSTGNIRLEVGIDYRIMGNDFYTKQTSQVQEQIPQLIGMIEQIVSNVGFIKCSVSWK
ncbi:hypothetical protein [Yersinia phage fHe-Yen9-04]|uniref:Uncharacterized protein n=2 Tax=Eneladusvirus Yen904 TaxID=2560849 RepID=A0A2C9CXV8_9CAUD|nr:hypothetical protein FDJ41_gp525 [Yersinia phage fHe-Yen9-04]SOK58655.1 hypothetical protein [Yersinia phage fHe-Yen9-04]SOK59191.1 hypothetical protein [Yersinia phage fHe-Yen9-03]VUE36424.1 hypothetical protein [Yersinia phage fHe-Yen9-04]